MMRRLVVAATLVLLVVAAVILPAIVTTVSAYAGWSCLVLVVAFGLGYLREALRDQTTR